VIQGRPHDDLPTHKDPPPPATFHTSTRPLPAETPYSHEGPSPPVNHKLIVGGSAALLAALLALGCLIGIAAGFAQPDDACSPGGLPTGDADLDAILHAIRTIESGGDYTAQAATSTASGAYQYVAGTWRTQASRAGIDVSRYPQAHLAPPHIQDAVAAANVRDILDAHDDVLVVPLIWYWPRATTDPAQLDVVPPGGNRLTPRQYQAKWLTAYTNPNPSPTNGQPPATCTPPTGPNAPAPGEPGRMTRPADGPVTSEFGQRWGRLHAGIDIGAPTGTPIYAAATGTVTSAGWRNGYGNTVTIDHGNNLTTLYAHQHRITTTTGAHVQQGTLIGHVGNTGNSTGPHLHFEVRVNGTPHNPRNYL
jgi:murein DD-endopeptidase MepM/ murein hydrolase activator NlpD